MKGLALGVFKFEMANWLSPNVYFIHHLGKRKFQIPKSAPIALFWSKFYEQ
jgi:hypothetical protein